MRLSVAITLNRCAAIAARSRRGGRSLETRTSAGIRDDAAARAPVSTGALRDSITVSGGGDGGGEVVVGADHGRFVEYGTVHAPAQPYLTPAVEAARPDFIAGTRALFEGA